MSHDAGKVCPALGSTGLQALAKDRCMPEDSSMTTAPVGEEAGNLLGQHLAVQPFYEMELRGIDGACYCSSA